MVCANTLVILTSYYFLAAGYIEHDHFDEIDMWGMRYKRGAKEIEEKFKREQGMDCRDVTNTTQNPFMAVVLYKTSGRLLCMGTIVDSTHILTAKKCYERVVAHELLVLAGCYSAYWSANSQVAHVHRIVRHEFEAAILVLKEADRLRYASNVQPVRLFLHGTKSFKINEFMDGTFTAIGFPVERFQVPGEYLRKEMYYEASNNVEIPIDECNKNYTKNPVEEYRHFCTWGNVSYCWGGWGGPILKSISGYDIQLGIIILNNCTEESYGPLKVLRTDLLSQWIYDSTHYSHIAT